MSKKKVLVVTYYWPPSGGGGVQRWLKMAKYLPQFGWKPIIFTPENPDFEIRDESLLGDVSPEINVIKLPIWEPFGIYRKILGKKAVQKQGVVEKNNTSLFSRISLWIRGNWFIPDPRIFWVRPAVRYLTNYLSNHQIDVIITTGPPHSMHLIGLEIKKRTGIKWLADFRDPWTDWDVLPQLNLNKRAWRYHKKLEQSVMHQADIVLTVTNRLASKLEKTGDIQNVEVITNGFDAADFEDVTSEENNKFRIAHVGLLNDGRNPHVLWHALDKLCKENPEFTERMEVVLVGTVDQTVIDSLYEYRHLVPNVVLPDYMSHNEVIKLYASSSVLLLLVNNTSNSSWILPGKLFEYLSAKKPILAFGQKESDANDVLLECGYDGIFEYNTPDEEIEATVLKHFSSFQNGQGDVAMKKVDGFERKKLTEDLSGLLNQLVS